MEIKLYLGIIRGSILMVIRTSIRGGIITMARKGLTMKTMAKGIGFLILDQEFQTILRKLQGQWSM